MSKRAPRRLRRFADITGGLVMAFVIAVIFMSYVALVFSGPLEAGRGFGLAMVLPGACLIGLLTVWRSGARTPLGLPDGNVVAVTASVAGGLAAAVAGHGVPGQMVGTVLAGLALTSVATGLALLLLGWLGAGRVIRFLPLQLNVAFEGTAGWLFATGGIGLALGTASGLGDMMADPMILARLAATIAGALAIVGAALLRLGRLAIPGTIIALTLAHHLGFALAGMSGDGVRAAWFIHLPEASRLTPVWTEPLSRGVDWAALGEALPALAALVLFGVGTIFVNLIGQEEMDGVDLDMEAELPLAGVSSLFSGLMGGLPGSLNPETGRLLRDTGGGSRGSILLAVLLAATLPVLAPGLIGQIPITVLGAILLAMGLRFGAEWILLSRRQLSILEWPMVLAVVAVAILSGPIAALLVGLVLGTMGFALVYARSMPIGMRYRGDVALSNAERPGPDIAFLAARPEARLILHLRGYLFFGTAARVEEDVRDEVLRAGGRLETIILDFAEVEGIDVSAAATIEALARFIRQKGGRLALAAMAPPIFARVLGTHPDTAAITTCFATLDQALEWSEDLILGERARAEPPTSSQDDLVALLARTLKLQPVTVRAGTVVIQQGDESHDLIFVLDGRVGITRRHGKRPPVRVRTFTAGTMVGEIGFFLGDRRTATVLAEEDCRILVVTRDDLARLRAENPAEALAFLRGVEERLCKRIRDKDHQISGLLRASRFQR